MYDYYMRGVFMGDVSDIKLMRDKGIIGLDLKPGLLRGSVIIFWNSERVGGVWVRVEGDTVICRHTCNCGLSPADMYLAALNVVLTQYQDYTVKYEPEPIYSAAECGKAYIGEAGNVA